MKRAALALALLALIGCEWMSPSQTITIEQIQDTQPNPPISGGGGTGTTITGLRAERAACTDGGASCSSFRLFWSGGSPPWNSISTRQEDGATWPQTLNGSGLDLIDPGPSGASAGTWSVTLNGAGPITVTLES
jgi:hypothetical protein